MKKLRALLLRPDALPIGILVFLPVLFLWKVIILKCDLFYDDIEFVFYNIRSLLFEMGRARHLYLWNPYELSGMDCVGDIQKGMFYPLNIFFYFVPTGPALTLYTLLHFLICGLSTYLLLRSRGASSWASLCGGCAFTFGSFIVLHISSQNFLGTICWLPLLLYFSEKTFCTLKLEFALCCGALMALMFLAGSPQIFYYVCLFQSLYLVYKLAHFFRARELTHAGAALLLSAVVILFSFSLSAVQLFPFIDVSSHTFRQGGTSYEFCNSYCETFRMLKTLLVPYFYGNLHQGTYTGDWYFFDAVSYFGILPLFLAVLGLLRSRDGLRNFFLAVMILAGGTALGKNFIFFPLCYKFVPFFDMFRAHCRLMSLVNLGVAVSAAWGLDSVLAGDDRVTIRRILTITGSVILLALALALGTEHPVRSSQIAESGWMCILTAASWLILRAAVDQKIGRTAFAVGAILILLIDLGSFGARYVKAVPRSTVAASGPFGAIPADGGRFRICTNTYSGADEKMIQKSMRFGRENIQGFNALAYGDYVSYLFYNEMLMLPSTEFIERLRIPSYAFIIANYRSTPVSLLNVKYYFALSHENKLEVRENDNFLPRYFYFENVAVYRDREKILKYMTRPDFDPRRTGFLEETLSQGEKSLLKRLARAPCKSDEVKEVSYSPDDICLKVMTSTPKMLFMSEVYYPGWAATLDGVPVKIFRCNYIFRAIAVPTGAHELRMKFIPPGYLEGLRVTVAALIILCVAAAFIYAMRLKRARAPLPASPASGEEQRPGA